MGFCGSGPWAQLLPGMWDLLGSGIDPCLLHWQVDSSPLSHQGKSQLKAQHSENIVAPGPITSREIDGKRVETVSDFIFWGSKITADGDCSHEIKRHLLLERKVMTNLDSIFKSRDIILPTKVCLVKAMVFPVVMYGCESWTIKKAEHQRIDGFELWCWRGLLRVPWTARWSIQSILKEISPEYSLEGLMLKLKLQYFGHLMRRTDSFEKTLIWEWLKARGEGEDRGWDGWMTSPTQWAWVWVNSRSWWWTGRPGVLQSMGSQGVGHHWATELNWPEPRGKLLQSLKLKYHWFTVFCWFLLYSKVTHLNSHVHSFPFWLIPGDWVWPPVLYRPGPCCLPSFDFEAQHICVFKGRHFYSCC